MGEHRPPRDAIVDSDTTGTHLVHRTQHRHGSRRHGAAPVTSWRRAYSLLYFEVTTDEVGDPWTPGPLPVRLPDGRHADRDARSTYFQPRAADSLYGRSDGSSICRWHRVIEDHELTADIIEVELLSFPHYAHLKTETQEQVWIEHSPNRYLAVIHIPLSDTDPLVQLEKAIKLAPENEEGQRQREKYASLLGPSFRIGSQVRRAQSVTFLTHRNKLEPPANAPAHWAPETDWLWYAASATRLNTFCPDTDDPHLLDGLVYLSISWRSLVLRDGISFIGLVSDDEPEGTGFFPWAEAYVRSLYIDVALLAALQRDGLNDFANRLARIGNRFEKSAEFRRLINEMTEFRNVFWWDHVTHHGAANEILLRLHDAHRTPELFDWITTDLDAFKQQVEAQALEASVRIQKVEEKRARKFEHTASIAAIAFALPALIFAGLTVPIRGLTSDGHNIPGWAVIVVGILALIIGAVAGAIGGHWLSRRS